MPSIKELYKIVDLVTNIIFPGYFTDLEQKRDELSYSTGDRIIKLEKKLEEQILRVDKCKLDTKEILSKFINTLPQLRQKLANHVIAAYEGDPAATCYSEAIFCYPSIKAMINYSIAHELYKLDVPLIPRIISEFAHSETGIDIHPGATIGENFFIDHGTGVVIGETTIIGNNVRLYQGVTLGAKSMKKDKEGRIIKGEARHPIIQDNVVIYSQATILGRITIGSNSVIGGNVWLTESIPERSKILK